MRNDDTTTRRISARELVHTMPDSVLRMVIVLFIDNKPRTVEDLWDYIDGRTDRTYSYSEKLRRVSTYICRANIELERTTRVIARVSRGQYRLLHRKI